MSKKTGKRNWDEIVRTEGIRFKYLRYRGRIVATICYTHQAPDLISYGAAFVSKKDTPTKEIGRSISYARLHKMYVGPYRTLIGLPGKVFRKISDINITIGENGICASEFERMMDQWEFESNTW